MGFATTKTKAIEQFSRSVNPVMIRDLEGNILFWNRAAERNYQFPVNRAVGDISHRLLETVFPEPLAEINRELLRTGIWEGELIHTLGDGSRVKVHSKWEICDDEEKPRVIETNAYFKDLEPRSAYLTKRLSFAESLAGCLFRGIYWWLVPAVLTLLTLEVSLDIIQDFPLSPLYD